MEQLSPLTQNLKHQTQQDVVFCYKFSKKLYKYAILHFLKTVKWNCKIVWLLLRAERSPMQICIDDKKTFFLQLEIFLAGAGITSTEKTPPLRHAQEKGEGGDDRER